MALAGVFENYADSYDTTWVERVGARIEHHAVLGLVLAMAGTIGVGLFPPSGLIGFLTPIVLVALTFASYALMRVHDGKMLCEPCLSGFAATPSRDARKLRRRLWTVHTLAEPRFMVLYAALLIGSNFFPGEIGRYAWAAVQASTIYVLVGVRSHRRLQPWCPWADRSLMRKRLTKRRHSCTPASQPA